MLVGEESDSPSHRNFPLKGYHRPQGLHGQDFPEASPPPFSPDQFLLVIEVLT